MSDNPFNLYNENNGINDMSYDELYEKYGKQFEEYLREAADEVRIFDLVYDPVDVLKNVDETAYREMFLAYVDDVANGDH